MGEVKNHKKSLNAMDEARIGKHLMQEAGLGIRRAGEKYREEKKHTNGKFLMQFHRKWKLLSVIMMLFPFQISQ